jgi:hypothetical protein
MKHAGNNGTNTNYYNLLLQVARILIIAVKCKLTVSSLKLAAAFNQSTCNQMNSLLHIGNRHIIWSYLLHFQIRFIDSSEFIQYKYNYNVLVEIFCVK